MFDLLIRGGTAVLPDGARPMDLAVQDGRIAALLLPGAPAEGRQTLDARGLLTQERREASGDISRGDFAALLVDAVQAVLPAEELAAWPPADPSFFDDEVEGDALLYAAKERGRGQFVIGSPDGEG